MKYEPKSKPKSEMEALMLPFVYDFDDGTSKDELLDIIQETIGLLTEEDRTIIAEIFYLRKTYEELAGTLNLKAKSHAWTKTKTALDRLKVLLKQNARFMEITNGYH